MYLIGSLKVTSSTRGTRNISTTSCKQQRLLLTPLDHKLTNCCDPLGSCSRTTGLSSGLETDRVFISPFSQQFEGHEGEDEEAEHEEQEDVEDLRQSVPDAPERSAELNTNKHTNRHTNRHS